MRQKGTPLPHKLSKHILVEKWLININKKVDTHVNALITYTSGYRNVL